MQQNIIKTYSFNEQLQGINIINKYNLLKNELIDSNDNLKFITLTIEIIHHSSKKQFDSYSIEIISNYKLNIQNKHDSKFNAEINRNIHLVNRYSNIDKIKNIKFNEIKFTISPITWYQFINKDEYRNLVSKLIKRLEK